MKLGEEIQKIPGFNVYFHHVKSLDISRYIFDKNYQDLVSILDFVTIDPRGNKLHSLENQDKLYAFGYEFICKLIFTYFHRVRKPESVSLHRQQDSGSVMMISTHDLPNQTTDQVSLLVFLLADAYSS